MNRISVFTEDAAGNYTGLVDIYRVKGSVEISETGIDIGELRECEQGAYVFGQQVCFGNTVRKILVS